MISQGSRGHADENYWDPQLHTWVKSFCSARAALFILLVTLQDTLFFYQVFSLRKRSHFILYLEMGMHVHSQGSLNALLLQGCVSLSDPRRPLLEVAKTCMAADPAV